MPKLNKNFLGLKKVPKLFWPGLFLAVAMGWTGWTQLMKVDSFYKFPTVFPTKTIVVQAIDGDTVELQNGLTFRLLGINAPDRGQNNYSIAAEYLNSLLEGKTVTIEYDKYQDDKYGRILGYIFLPCEPQPLSKTEKVSTLPLRRDAGGFQQGDTLKTSALSAYCRNHRALINEILVKEGYAQAVIYQDRRPLKYANYFVVSPSLKPSVPPTKH